MFTYMRVIFVACKLEFTMYTQLLFEVRSLQLVAQTEMMVYQPRHVQVIVFWLTMLIYVTCNCIISVLKRQNNAFSHKYNNSIIIFILLLMIFSC